MNYKLKSLVYLFAFILSALLYYQVESSENAEDHKNLPELTLQKDKEAPVNNDAVL